MTRLLRLLLCASLAAPALLPAAHEWQVARDEAGHHESAGGPAREAFSQEDAEHRHHDADHCRICPQLSSTRGAAPASGEFALLPPGASARLSRARRAAVRAREPGAKSPRGPPAA